MRTAFGKYCERLRVERGMSQTMFSEKTGMSLSRISNIECQRTNISDEVLNAYFIALGCSGEERCELRKRARFSNGMRKEQGRDTAHSPLRVMLDQFGDQISPTALQDIQKILERETGEQIASLRFSSNQSDGAKSLRKKRNKRPELSPKRLSEIALFAHDQRRKVCGDMEKLKVDYALQVFSVREENLDYRVQARLPPGFDGAFACIMGHKEGHTVILEEDRFLAATRGVYFSRHVICHEIAHHFLHGDLLKSDDEIYLAPQELSKNFCKMMGTERQIEQLVDSIPEVEAECFATFLLVPWEAFIKGTDAKYLSQDYGEQPDEVKRYLKFFKNNAVLDAFRHALWNRGVRRHPIFD